MGGLYLLLVLIMVAAVTVLYIIKTKHIETMAKIEHGIIEDKKTKRLSIILNLGIFFLFLGVGVFVEYLIPQYSRIPRHVTSPAGLLLIGGLGLIVCYIVNNRINR